MKKLSVAIATYNEEENIEKCLHSIASCADEIIIVDGSSKDRTVEIAKKYKAKITITDNPLIFHINKQKAIDACSGDWILQLDADEVITGELKEEIINIINLQPTTNNSQLINGYWIPRKNYFLGRFLMKGGQYPDYTLRLYRRGKGKLPCKSVHEQAEIIGKTAYIQNPLLHFPYANFSEYLERFNRYTDIFADEYQKSKLELGLKSFIAYIFFKPSYWFISTYFRHKGFMDGIPGFIFSFCSSMRFPISYIKYWEKEIDTNKKLGKC